MDLESLGPRSSGRRRYDQVPWFAKVISTSGIAGLIAVMLIINQQKATELDKKLSNNNTDRLVSAISELHKSIEEQSKSINALNTQVQLLRQALRVQAIQGKLGKHQKLDSLGWEANEPPPLQP